MFLEKLNGVVEKDLANLLEEFKRDAPERSEMAPNGAINADLASSPERQAVWSKFREQLIGLTEVTRTHFVKLVQVLALPSHPSISPRETAAACKSLPVNVCLQRKVCREFGGPAGAGEGAREWANLKTRDE